jgi:hypothetical protein
MSFNSLMTLLTTAAVGGLEARPTVIELGNQRFRPSTRVLETVAERLEGRDGIDHAALRDLLALSKERRLERTATFYEALGFSRYVAIDVNERFGSLRMDLNKDLAAAYDYTERFSLVTNNGTGEHVFNQYMVFKNVHELCERGGLMLHCVPFINWVNHGFYSFHPNLYVDVAAANGYEIELIGFADRAGRGFVNEPATGRRTLADQRILQDERRLPIADLVDKSDFGLLGPARRVVLGAAATLARLRSRRYEKRRGSTELTRALARSLRRAPARKLLVFAALRKISGAEFKAPFQGRYADDITDATIKADYS